MKENKMSKPEIGILFHENSPPFRKVEAVMTIIPQEGCELLEQLPQFSTSSPF